MLRIKLSRDRFNDKYIHWSIGEKFSLNNFEFVVEVNANADELNLIKNKFCVNPDSHPLDRRYTIPIDVNATSFTWFGDIAKTIVGNL